MNTSSDRVQVVQLGELLHPGACALCGNGTCVDGYVDTSIFYDYEGTVYLCMRCVEQICSVVGALLPDEVSQLRQHTAEIATKCAELEAENNVLRSKLDAWYTVIDGAIDHRTSDSNADEKPEPSEPSKSVNSPEPSGRPEAGKPVAKKSTASRRSVNASQSASSNFVV